VNVSQTILVVDDNRDAADSTAMLLRLSNHNVHVAYGGQAAIDTAIGVCPDIVLLDVGLPVLDGYEVARRLRANPRTQHVRLIAITGFGQPEDMTRAREAGFDAHLLKPVDLEALDALIAARS
jgi:CheY-like chemotaxis protein